MVSSSVSRLANRGVALAHTRREVGRGEPLASTTIHIPEKVLRRSAHVVMFAALSALALAGFGWIGMVVTAVWSLLNEITKIPVPERH